MWKTQFYESKNCYKIMYIFTGKRNLSRCGAMELCMGQCAGAEAAVHAISECFQ